MSNKPTDTPKTGHDALLAKMDALVGRHRTNPGASSDEIPVLTDVIGAPPPLSQTQPLPQAMPPAVAAPAPPPATPAPAPRPSASELFASLEPDLTEALTRELSEHIGQNLQAHLANLIREAFERESAHIAKRIATRVVELVRERAATQDGNKAH
jgi:hypothetical protein